MSTLTKKRPTKKVKVVLFGPITQKEKLLAQAKQLQFEEDSETDSVPALEALSQYVDLNHLPGITLRVHRENADMTQKELAEALGVKQHHISEMENSKRPIGKELAKKLSTVFETDYRVYL